MKVCVKVDIYLCFGTYSEKFKKFLFLLKLSFWNLQTVRKTSQNLIFIENIFVIKIEIILYFSLICKIRNETLV